MSQYREQFPDADLVGDNDRKRRAANARVQNAANFAGEGRPEVKAKMSRKAKVRAKQNAIDDTPAWRTFQAAALPFTAETWEDPEWRERMQEVSRDNMVKLLEKIWADPKHVKRQSDRLKRQWADPAWREKVLSALLSSDMNNLESAVFERLQPLGFTWEGGGTFWVHHDGRNMNPDFVHRKQKVIVEVFGDYWHRNESGQDRVDHFANYGWDTFIVWESDFKENPDRSLVEVFNCIC